MLDSPAIPHRKAQPVSDPMTDARAKLYINTGVVTDKSDIYNILRPLLKQTVTYTYRRGAQVTGSGTGWVERIVVDDPDTSTYFTPISISLNVDSFEHLEFDTRPDQLLVYTLVQADERVIIEYAPLTTGEGGEAIRGAEQLTFDTSGFVQMELQGLAAEPEAEPAARPAPEGDAEG